MSKMFKSLDFAGANTVKNLAPPTQDGDAIRQIDLTGVNTSLSQAINLVQTEEAQNRSAAISTLNAEVEADIAALEAAYQAADLATQNALTTRINELSSGFAIREPVYAILTAQVALSGLTVSTPSFAGTLPNGARVLTNAQGGDTLTPHADNRVWIASAGSWTPSADLEDGTVIDRAFLVSIQNGADEYNDSVYILVDPVGPYSGQEFGISELRWSRWQSVDRVLADDLTLTRAGTTISAKLNPDDLHVTANGIAVTPALKTLLRDLSNATGNLPVEQVSGLAAYLATLTLNYFATVTSDLSLGGFKLTGLADPISNNDAVNLQTLNSLELPVAQVVGLLAYLNTVSLSQLAVPTADLSLANFKLTNLAPPTTSGDAVSLGHLTSVITNLQTSLNASKVAADLADPVVVGNDTEFVVTHNFGSRDFTETVYDKDTGETVSTDFFRIVTSEDLNTCKVIFKNQTSISASKYRILLIKVA